MKGLELLLNKVESGTILTEAIFSNIDLEAVLDQRDDPSFENAWITAFQRIETAAGDQPVRAAESRFIEAIREETFKLTYKHTQNPEISSYVSDDFELIAKALVVLVNDPWVNALLLSYKRATFPCGSLDPEEGHLPDLLE